MGPGHRYSRHGKAEKMNPIFALLLSLWVAWSILIILAIFKPRLPRPSRQWWRCAWCGAWFDNRGSIVLSRPYGAPRGHDSHGICNDCGRQHFPDDFPQEAAATTPKLKSQGGKRTLAAAQLFHPRGKPVANGKRVHRDSGPASAGAELNCKPPRG